MMTNKDYIQQIADNEKLADLFIVEIEGDPFRPCTTYLAVPVQRVYISRGYAKKRVKEWLESPLDQELFEINEDIPNLQEEQRRKKYLHAVNVVCNECVCASEEMCSRCPVRISTNKLKKEDK